MYRAKGDLERQTKASEEAATQAKLDLASLEEQTVLVSLSLSLSLTHTHTYTYIHTHSLSLSLSREKETHTYIYIYIYLLNKHHLKISP